jgi:hypothetical protein
MTVVVVFVDPGVDPVPVEFNVKRLVGVVRVKVLKLGVLLPPPPPPPTEL